MNRSGILLLLLVLVACGDDDATVPDGGTDAGEGTDSGVDDSGTDAGELDAGVDSGPPGPACAEALGLYVDSTCENVGPDILAYSPRFWLWSDATDKERFIRFPEGSVIDTRNRDAWVFPVGTKIWKTFSLDGRRLETRVMEKTESGTGAFNWQFRTYLWSEDGRSVTEVINGQADVLDTGHDIPPQARCIECHGPAGGGSPDAVLGFGTIQLAHDDTETNLETLAALELVSETVTNAEGAIPGDEATVAALGYLHANCGNCHGPANGAVPPPGGGLGLWVEAELENFTASAVYRTAVRTMAVTWRDPLAPENPIQRVAPGNPEGSAVFRRMELRGIGQQMPPLATDVVHTEGLEIIAEWIRNGTFPE
jgi:mono/diheme cytochrome c family protein